MSKAKSPSFQFYPDAWLSSTSISLMTSAEEAGYLRLLCHAWMSEDCGLPDDDSKLASLSRLGGANWARSKATIRAKFRLENGRLFNDRLLEERAKQEEWRKKSSAGGKTSAARRTPHPDPPLNKFKMRDGPPTPSPVPAVDGNCLSHSESTKDLKGGCQMVDPLVPTKTQHSYLPSSSSSSDHVLPTNHPWKLTVMAVREFDPTTSLEFVGRLVAVSEKYCEGKGAVTDVMLSEAVRECRRIKNGSQRSAGLFLQTVPRCVCTWLTQGKAKPIEPQRPKTPTQEAIEIGKARRQQRA